MYDIIGDVHGHYEALVILLKDLGYEKRQGAYRHPERQAVFVGDIVNRGSGVRETLREVRNMVEAGQAHAVLGNHEYNLICWDTEAASGGFLRPHSERNHRQVIHSLQAYADHPEEWAGTLDWLRGLPLFLDLEGVRVVHACWDAEIIAQLEARYQGSTLTESLLHDSVKPMTLANQAIERLLKGVEIQLPRGWEFADVDGNVRKAVRLKWWEDFRGKTFRELAVRDAQHVPGERIPEGFGVDLPVYGPDSPPLFLGHYCLSDDPGPLTSNIACVDYCVYKRAQIVAYRWQGENQLLSGGFHWAPPA